jgi:hypothetical protein
VGAAASFDHLSDDIAERLEITELSDEELPPASASLSAVDLDFPPPDYPGMGRKAAAEARRSGRAAAGRRILEMPSGLY